MLTVILLLVALLLHLILPLQAVTVKVAVSALHRLVLLAEITGATGILPVLIVMSLLVPLSPQLLLQVAE